MTAARGIAENALILESASAWISELRLRDSSRSAQMERSEGRGPDQRGLSPPPLFPSVGHRKVLALFRPFSWPALRDDSSALCLLTTRVGPPLSHRQTFFQLPPHPLQTLCKLPPTPTSFRFPAWQAPAQCPSKRSPPPGSSSRRSAPSRSPNKASRSPCKPASPAPPLRPPAASTWGPGWRPTTP